MESMTMFPDAFCLVIVRVTLPPLEPDVPQESACARRKLPSLSLLVIVLFFRLMDAVVLVTYRVSPLFVVMSLLVAVNSAWPSAASPLMD